MRTAVCVPGHVIRGEQSGKARRAYPPSGGLSVSCSSATVRPRNGRGQHRPIITGRRPVSDDRQTMLLHAVPLLILAGLYGLVSVLLGVSLLRERRASGLGLGIWLLFTVVAVLSALLGRARARGRTTPSPTSRRGSSSSAPPRSPCRASSCSCAGHERALLVTARRRVREAEEIATERGREADAISRLSTRARPRPDRRGRRRRRSSTRWRRCSRPTLLLLARVDEELRTRDRLRRAGRRRGRGGGASCSTSTRTPERSCRSSVTVRRSRSTTSSPRRSVNRALADASGGEERRVRPAASRRGTSSAFSSRRRRRATGNFTDAELELVQGLASEAALALGRARSNEALACRPRARAR